MVQKDVPMKLSTTVKKTELTYIKVTCKSASGTDVKEEVPKYSGEESLESFLLTIRTIQTLAKRYKWLEEPTVEEGETVKVNGIDLALETVSRALGEDPLETWEASVSSLRSNQRNEAGFNRAIRELVNEECGPDAYDEQLEYMKTTAKPEDMDVNTWWRRLFAMNKSLTVFEGGSQLTMSQFNKEVIMPGLNSRMRVKYIEQGGKKFATKNDIKELLNTLEDADEEFKRSQQPRNTKNHRNGRGQKPEEPEPEKPEPEGPNKCRLPDHNHDFKDCPNNPKAKNYNGTHYSKLWKKVKEERAKEKELSMLQVESDAQKKVSFADVMGQQEDSDAEDYFSTAD